MEREPILSTRQLSCRRGRKTVLRSISVDVMAGTVVAVVGPNGSGKTTLIDCICGLIPVSQGSIRVLGVDAPATSNHVKQRIGVLTQETALYSDLTVRQNLRFMADLYGTNLDRIEAVLDLVGMGEYAGRAARELSGGMRRRVAIARMLLHDPPLLLMDEPTIAIDADARHQIWGHIRLLRSQGRTILLTTNHLDEAESLADRVLLLRDGEVVSDAPPAEMLRRVGRPLELESDERTLSRLANLLREDDRVLRSVLGLNTLTLYLKEDASPQDVLARAAQFGTLRSFRLRSPDLAEMFETMTPIDPVSGQ